MSSGIMTATRGNGPLAVHDVAPAPPSEIDGGAAHARFVQRLRRRYAQELSLLAVGAPTRAAMADTFAALRAQGHDCSAALRVLRQLVMERLATLDCEEQAPLAVVVRGVTELAEFALDIACAEAFATLDARHGVPTNADGSRCEFWVVGMGKLGGRELNVSSDIDLVYVYEAEGETPGNADGRGRISHHEYFAQVVRTITQLVGDTTEHGFVFRVDLMLRPNGHSGPAAVSLAALEEYFVVQGREWERFAWLKSRVVAPRACLGGTAVLGLRQVVLPFVFRRYLDYSVFDGLRDLHRQIREHATRRSAGKPERANDVKLSRGGIREIEFTVQLLQVVRGGQFPELRHRATLQALRCLTDAGLMAEDTAAALAEAYTFLRRVEHRIQYLDDQQTHALPTADADLEWIARTMGYTQLCPFLHDLDGHRERVAQEFDTLLGGNAQAACNGKGVCGRAAGAPPDFDALLERLPERVRERMREWRGHPRINALRDVDRTRLLKLLQRTALWLADGSATEESAVQMADWIEPLLRRQNYLALLLERPAVHRRLLHLLGAAKWPARYLRQHPGVIDELAGPFLLAERFNAAEYEDELERRLASVTNTAEDDDETLLNLLRRAHHAEVFRTLARDVEGVIGVEQVADDLSALADATLRITARWCWSRLKQRHREEAEPPFAVIGYGKLGGKELGYGSDLDIVFVYHDEDDRASEVYSAFVRKLINWLTVKTADGDIYEIDTALRPNGNSGMLVTSFEAYAKYQERRGSNTAWTWEHQAMTRARCVLAPPTQADGFDWRARFDAVREAVITAPRDAAALAQEIVAMREKVRAAHPVKAGRFDVKHSRGGMVDAEFAVQYLVLSASGEHAGLRENVGNIALLQRAEAAQLLPPGVGQRAADAYRVLRREQHRARLNEEPTQLVADAMAVERDAIQALWSAVFG
ncbi:bifunctional [glutamate--ammonia ligase]-adenylyl-L-tyrosine phosphorylase/[glutamate--ammonia-ligase] adenylyltransferase [Xylophilus sp. GOD-11R]|uniref:bifunctional [glutamate--ammonia ligase]-adenylyl-L-tyrosine phosphorylase/[glutamate--ammonia-ligase] adenylyltransferase n=1 Tax=Xylophilus sp. GOD-11R TaxID=3089814 RepID=UPI00298CFE0D|nr:bifunctional [glutamate--ammonia ligase]-adenylyl-L-tyrosine phosphorylase/[glutamate--ammonia-ligase] adenylyltransferase [Xylophilus sp. GOD-11R]WPB57123.1 bifunctional [glutamate--ammonia ligase]-adenylyl-L-tyrosine phosphorylase/[glutamate--ammonia-ligase] adenylyltransferase [Xylophilus sp. GOD-11R]